MYIKNSDSELCLFESIFDIKLENEKDIKHFDEKYKIAYEDFKKALSHHLKMLNSTTDNLNFNTLKSFIIKEFNNIKIDSMKEKISSVDFLSSSEIAKTLRPSNSSQWMFCPYSAIYQTLWDKEIHPVNEGAKKGIFIHKIVKEIFEKGIKSLTNEYQDQRKEFEAAFKFYCFVKQIYHPNKSKKYYVENLIFSEKILNFPNETKLCGTPDVFYIINDSLMIFDLKTGKIPVNAYNNKQLMCYAYLICENIKYIQKIEIKNIFISIYNPIYNYWSGEKITPEQLKTFEKKIENSVKRVFEYKEKKHLRASKLHCNFCPGKNYCDVCKKSNVLYGNYKKEKRSKEEIDVELKSIC